MIGKPIFNFWAVMMAIGAVSCPGYVAGQTVFRIEHFSLEDGLSYRWTYDVAQDSLGFLWIAAFDGINRYDGHRFAVYRPYFPEFPDFQSKLIAQVDCRLDGEIWATSKQGILTRLNQAEDQFELIWPTAERKFPLKGRPFSGPQDGHGLGLVGRDITSQEWFARIAPSHQFDSLVALSPPLFLRKQITPLLDGKRFWVYSDRHYAILDPGARAYQTYAFAAIPGAAIAHPKLPIDGQSRFWHPAPEGGFRSFRLPAGVPLQAWDDFKLDNKGNFWVWARDKTTYRYNPSSGVLEHFGRFDFWEHEIGSPFEDREGIIWIPHFYGLTKLMQQRRLFDNYLHEPLNELGNAPGGKSVYMIREAEDGAVYIQAHGQPVFCLRPGASAPEAVPEFPSSLLREDEALAMAAKEMLQAAGLYFKDEPVFFHDAPSRAIWLCQKASAGVYRVDLARKGQYELFELSEATQTMIVLLHADGYLWAGTDNGLYRLEPQSGEVLHYTTREGLPHNIVYSIVPDGPALWLGTHYGLCRFDPRSGETKNYYREDGLTHNEFNTRSALRASDGKLYFGGLNGINAFYPAELEQAELRSQARLHLSRFSKLGEREGRTAVWNGYMLEQLGTLRLRPGDRSFAFEFFINSFINPSQNRYSYYLDGWEAPWANSADDGRAFYPHLPPGSYTLRVKAIDPFGNAAANEIALPIYMPQVWYRRWWAWSLYTLALLGGGLLFYRVRLRQHLERREALRRQELDEMKTKLYTNITHEFRTPLTVILGMAEQLMGDGAAVPAAAPLALIKRNGENLLHLVNQMLDLAKLESGKLSLHLVQADIIGYLRYITSSFQSFAAQKQIELHYLPEPEQFHMDFDQDRMLNILSNLLSNAIKFTPEGGHIYVQANSAGDRFVIKVKDTGIGIPADKLPQVFDRFYQVDDAHTRRGEGTGIGLTLARELVKMMGGEISVKSQLGKGTIFSVVLPVTRQAPLVPTDAAPPLLKGYAPTEAPELAAEQRDEADLPLLLVAEDNLDLARYIRSCLEDKYRVIHAADGAAAIAKAIEEVPDLIVSDVMMPEKDGFELLQTLKQDGRTSHIPIVLLTAKADIDSKLEGLERGADAYLPKPFHHKELQLRLRNLLEQQKRLQEKYAGQDFSAPLAAEAAKVAAGPEDVFLQNAARAVLKRLDDAAFGNEALARALAMSESQLNRKIKALTGKTLSLFIRSLRLREARKMLVDNAEVTISEVAYAVGFTDPAYFSRTFSQEFGQAPSALRG